MGCPGKGHDFGQGDSLANAVSERVITVFWCISSSWGVSSSEDSGWRITESIRSSLDEVVRAKDWWERVQKGMGRQKSETWAQMPLSFSFLMLTKKCLDVDLFLFFLLGIQSVLSISRFMSFFNTGTSNIAFSPFFFFLFWNLFYIHVDTFQSMFHKF